jgi:AAA15 family ATPase/GTPase|tara:strand:+ start:455 stop:766 length:312 start_codon:yes stop_codon:yes gene_type:complete
MTEETIKKICYTKEEVDAMIAAAVAEARAIDEESMRKHNRDATIISMILGFTCLALFVDGLLRILGIIPPFMDLDVNVIDDIIDKVEGDVLPLIKQKTNGILR